MPCDATDSRQSPELVNRITRNEVNVIVTQTDVGIANALATQLVQFGVINPSDALQNK